GSFGAVGIGQYTSMPVRESLGESAATERIVNATVVVLAPDADGNARNLAIGTGAVIAADDARAWIVTCSHVAMPYAALASVRGGRVVPPPGGCATVGVPFARRPRGQRKGPLAPPAAARRRAGRAADSAPAGSGADRQRHR